MILKINIRVFYDDSRTRVIRENKNLNMEFMGRMSGNMVSISVIYLKEKRDVLKQR